MAGQIWPVDAVTGAPPYSGRTLRQTTTSISNTISSTSRPLGGVAGVRPGTPTTIVTATSTTWTVTPFGGVIDGATAAIAGTYGYAFSANQTGSVTAAGASARTDRLDVQVVDPAEAGVSGANPLIQIVYTVGTPTLAAAPAQSHPLAQINVPISGGGSPTVTWTASYFAAPGGFVEFLTLAALQLWTPADPGQHARVIADPAAANNRDYFWDSVASLWRPQYPWYREYALSRSAVTDGSTFFMVATETTANATVNSFTVANTSGTNGLLVLEAGLYMLTISVHMGAVTTGTSLAQIRNSTSGGPIIARGGVALPADPYGQSSAVFRANGTDAIITEVNKVTGGSTNPFGVLKVTKIGSL